MNLRRVMTLDMRGSSLANTRNEQVRTLNPLCPQRVARCYCLISTWGDKCQPCGEILHGLLLRRAVPPANTRGGHSMEKRLNRKSRPNGVGDLSRIESEDSIVVPHVLVEQNGA